MNALPTLPSLPRGAHACLSQPGLRVLRSEVDTKNPTLPTAASGNRSALPSCAGSMGCPGTCRGRDSAAGEGQFTLPRTDGFTDSNGWEE